MTARTIMPYSQCPECSGVGLLKRLAAAAVLAVRDHQDLGLVDPALGAITITIAVTAIADPALRRLCESGAEDPCARCFKAVQRLDGCPRASLPAFDDEEGASSCGSEQRGVGKAEARRTVD